MLGRHTPLCKSNVVHNEFVNNNLKTFLQALVVISWASHIKMQVAVANMAIPSNFDGRLLS